MLRDQLSILVSSTDSYSDCWSPFFNLWKYYWPDNPCRIYLAAETKTQDSRDLEIINHRDPAWAEIRPAWSELLNATIERIETPYVLYLQEDYFLCGHVPSAKVFALVRWCQKEKADCLRLTDPFGLRETHSDISLEDMALRPVKKDFGYFASLQAAIWKKSWLQALLAEPMSPWQFERRSTLKAQMLDATHWYVLGKSDNPQISSVFPYFPTGVVKGRWYEPAIVELFKQHDIKVDYSTRGFYRPNQLGALTQRVRSGVRRSLMKSALGRWIFRHV
jgi:hypothetical protein